MILFILAIVNIFFDILNIIDKISSINWLGWGAALCGWTVVALLKFDAFMVGLNKWYRNKKAL